jgi:DNA gyrase subunit A
MKHTTIQSRFACNMIGLVDGLPKTLTLKDFLRIFLDFRCEIVEKRAQFDLAKAKKRLHLVDGFLLAMSNMDQVVTTIRAAKDGDSAMQELQTTFMLTKEQAQGVMNLTLRRLTSMENKMLEGEQAELNAKIQDLEDLIARKERILKVVETEATKIAEQHGDDRRTNIVRDEGKFSLSCSA